MCRIPKSSQAARRLYLAEQISLTSHYSLAFVHAGIIDSLNILQASLRGMKLVHQALSCWEKLEIPVAVDGNRTPQGLRKAYGVVGGDARILEIAAASILGKSGQETNGCCKLQAATRNLPLPSTKATQPSNTSKKLFVAWTNSAASQVF